MVNAVDIRPACIRDASYVVAMMRARDAHELYCQLPPETTATELTYALVMGGEAFVAYRNDVPVMLFGTTPMSASCLSVWAVGTRHTWRVVGEVTKFFIETLLPGRMAEGYYTMEARSIVGHEQAHRWMRGTGAVVHGEPFMYGRDREKFLLFRWTADGTSLVETNTGA